MPPVKNKSLGDTLKYEAKQFCLNTSLHGYRFIVLPRRILLERVFWAVIVIIALAAASTLLCIAWINFQQNPTILVTDSTHHPIWNYPFPAVTICSFNKISEQQLDNFLKTNITNYGDFTPGNLKNEFHLLFQLINYNNPDIPQQNFSRFQHFLDLNGIKIDEVLRELATPCKRILRRCKWKGEEKRCESLFELIATSEGYCCSFNYYALKNHTFGGGNARMGAGKPRRVSACGYLTALEVLVDNEPHDYFAVQISSVGHKVLLHNSYSFPDWNPQMILTEKGIICLIGITPTITYSTDNIRGLSIDKRKCKFPDELVLYNYVTNFHNCMAECRMNLTVKYCGCIPFYYNNPTGSYPAGKICNLNDLPCLAKLQNSIRSSVPGVSNISKIKETSAASKCNCYPDCDYVDYLSEASSGVLTRKYATNQLNLYGDIAIKDHSTIRVYFNDLVSTKNRRDVSFSWHTLLAYYGGLLGLFIGFSFVTLVELVYFFTIRLAVDIRNRTKPQLDSNKQHKKNRGQLVQVQPNNFQTLNVRNLLVGDEFKLRHRSNSNS